MRLVIHMFASPTACGGRGVLLVGAHIGMLNVAAVSAAAHGASFAVLAGSWMRAHEHERAVQFDPVCMKKMEWVYRGGVRAPANGRLR